MVWQILLGAIAALFLQICALVLWFLLFRVTFLRRIFLVTFDCVIYGIIDSIHCLAYRSSTRHFMDIAGFELGRFTAIILSHEDVQIAVGHSIVVGMNMFLRQPNLDEHVLLMSETVARTQPELARKSGEDFPKLVGSFLQGMLSSSNQKNKVHNGNTTTVAVSSQNNDTTTTSSNNSQQQKNQQQNATATKGKIALSANNTTVKSASTSETSDPSVPHSSNNPTVTEQLSLQSVPQANQLTTGPAESPVVANEIDEGDQNKNLTAANTSTGSSPISFFGIIQNKTQRQSLVKKDHVGEKVESSPSINQTNLELGKDGSLTVCNSTSSSDQNSDVLDTKEGDVHLLLPSLNANNDIQPHKKQSENLVESFFGLKKRK